MIKKLVKQTLLASQKLADDKQDSDVVLDLLLKLAQIPSESTEDIRDKLLALASTNSFDVTRMNRLLDFADCLTYRNFEYVKNQSSIALGTLKLDEYRYSCQWSLLLGSFESDLERFSLL